MQEQEFERLGSGRTHQINVRLVAATHRDLAQMAAGYEFRSDLYYRLNVFPVVVPPLRERREDIRRLVLHFAEVFARRMGNTLNTYPRQRWMLSLHMLGRATYGGFKTSSNGL